MAYLEGIEMIMQYLNEADGMTDERCNDGGIMV